MAAHEDGEVEVTLGNKQLFAVLFVFVVLLGIFFALGFLAGRSTDTPTPQTASTKSTPASQQSAESAPPVTDTPAETPRQPLPLVTEPESSKPAETAAATPPPTSPSADAALEPPPPGKYLQVAATERRRDAEGMLNMLRKEGFDGTLTPSRRVPTLTAVLIGPFPSSDAIAVAREKLKKLNIDKPFAVEYK